VVKLIIGGLLFDWFAVTVQVETFTVLGTTTWKQQEIVRVRTQIIGYRTQKETRNRARLKALRQAQKHVNGVCSIDSWE
jgi:hypothetical protein